MKPIDRIFMKILPKLSEHLLTCHPVTKTCHWAQWLKFLAHWVFVIISCT